MHEALQAARLRLVKERPYLASAAWALRAVERPGLGTMAVDQYWRLYYDPAVCSRWTVEQLAGVLYHEIAHLLRDHSARMRVYPPQVANLAADAEINDDLLREGVALPGTPVTPALLGQPDDLLAEEYASALGAREPAPDQSESESAKPAETGTASPPGRGKRQGDGEKATARDTAPGPGPDLGPGNGSQPSSTPPGGGQADDPQPDPEGDAPDSQDGDSGGSKADGGGDSSSSSPSGQPSASPSQPVASSRPAPSPGSGRAAGAESEGSGGDRAQTPAPGAGRCGSCATGQQEEWEDGPPAGGDSSPGLGRAEAEIVRRDVARQIKGHVRARGTVAGHWSRWADEKLRPRVDWRRELAAAVRQAVADVAGASDYSYRRPSRRQGQVGNGKVVLPSLRRPVPEVAVVVDTSGSIGDTMLAQALAEVAGVLRAVGLRNGVQVLAVDHAVQSCARVFRPEQVKLRGGGGTDMGSGLQAASKLRPAPQVVVVLTDGETPWPSQPPRKTRVVVALTGNGQAPSWARTVKIEGGK